MKRYTKVLLLFILVMTAFHVGGLEMGFCDDGSSCQTTESHGCMACQPSHHSATLQQPMNSYLEFPVTFLFFEDVVTKLKEPTRFNLRPPISL